VNRAIWTSLKPRCFVWSMSSALMSVNCCVFSQVSACAVLKATKSAIRHCQDDVMQNTCTHGRKVFSQLEHPPGAAPTAAR
jgi:hypothetical protein